MKKVLCLLLAVMMALSFTACGEKQTEDASQTTTSTEQVATTESGEETVTTTKVDGDVTTTGKNKTTTAATTTTTTTTKKTTAATTTAKPTKLNPKTAFKFGTYTAAFFENNKQVYNKVSLFFYEEFTTVECGYSTYYTKEYYKTWYENMGMSFDDSYLGDGVVIDGTTYYYVDGYGGTVPESYELTDTVIKAAESGEFSLNQNGTLTLNKAHGSFGPAGTVYTFTAG